MGGWKKEKGGGDEGFRRRRTRVGSSKKNKRKGLVAKGDGGGEKEGVGLMVAKGSGVVVREEEGKKTYSLKRKKEAQLFFLRFYIYFNLSRQPSRCV